MKTSVLVVVACVALLTGAQAQQAPQGPSYALKKVTDTLPKGDNLEVRVRSTTLQPGVVGAWHTHPTPPAVYVVEGTVSFEFKDGTTVQAKAGEAVLEPINMAMRAMNKGDTPAKIVIFQVSPPDMPESHAATQ